MGDPWQNDHERWLFGVGPWTWRVALHGLSPVRGVRHYRALRRRRLIGFHRRRGWTRRGALRFVLWCCWRELTGWRRPYRPLDAPADGIWSAANPDAGGPANG